MKFFYYLCLQVSYQLTRNKNKQKEIKNDLKIILISNFALIKRKIKLDFSENVFEWKNNFSNGSWTR